MTAGADPKPVVFGAKSQSDVLTCPRAHPTSAQPVPKEGRQVCFLHSPTPTCTPKLLLLPEAGRRLSTCALGKLGEDQDPGRWHGLLVAVKKATAGASAEDFLWAALWTRCSPAK